MKITVELQSTLDIYLPDDAELERAILEVEEGSTPWDLIETLGIPPHRAHLVFVNGELLVRDRWSARELAPEEVVTVWPLLAGG